MVQFKPSQSLPARSLPVKSQLTEQDLPDTDNQPVDNELQVLLPYLLRSILVLAWADRTDWFLGVNIGLYHDPDQPAVGPDALLSLGVPIYRPDKDLRLSYVLWQEGVVPQWVLEVVSQKRGKEYSQKMALYADLGVQYYTVYNPKHYKRDGHDPFEVYRLIEGKYVRLPGNPVWMPEIGLGIGVGQGTHAALPTRDWLYWYDAEGNQYPTAEQVVETMRLQAEAAQQEAEAAAQQAEERLTLEQRQLDELLQKLRDRGIDPNTL